MELSPTQVNSLKTIVEEWTLHESRELEASFPKASDTSTFLDVAKRLKSKKYKELPQEDRLNIITPENIRFTLTGMSAIQNYCDKNSLQGMPYDVIRKDSTGMESTLDIGEYGVRVKVRRELPAEGTPEVVQMLSQWSEQKKAFRLIRRWTFMDEENGIRFDLSMVRTTPKTNKGGFKWQKLFGEHNLGAEPSHYEIEVELLPVQRASTSEEVVAMQAKALKQIIRGIGEVLRGIQRSSILIRKSQAVAVLEGYSDLTKTDRFRGVAPITLLLENMVPDVREKVPNIRTGYNVTEKADGLRSMGYVDGTGELFLLDMSLNVYRTGLIRKGCSNTLVDGEWVTQDSNSEAVNLFLVFDIYITFEGRDVSREPFTEEGRYGQLKEWDRRWNEGGSPVIRPGLGVTETNKLQVSAKTFHFGNVGDDSIFQKAAQILTTSFPYHTDGLIFTPNKLGLPQKPGVRFSEQLKWKPSEDNSVDFLIMFDKESPREELITIGSKQATGETVSYKTARLFVGSLMDAGYEDPRGTILFEQPLPEERRGRRNPSFKPVLFNPKDIPDTMANTCYMEITVDEGTGENIVACENGDILHDRTIVEMRYEPSNEEGWRWIPMRVRYDKTERYQKNIPGSTMNKDEAAEGVWNSIHEPVTQAMISTGRTTSAEKTAEIDESAASLVNASDIGRVYYEKKGQVTDLTLVEGLRRFHRVYIKESILLERGLRGGGKTLVDLTCGQGGDLNSWVKYKADFIYGTDIAGKGILDNQAGAYRRYLNAVMKYGGFDQVPRMIFTIGSSSKRLSTGDAGASSEESNIMRALYGVVEPDGPVPEFVRKYGKNRLRQGADCVTCMFAIHYFFQNDSTLTGFLENVSDSLKIGGLFVGCCFDGRKVFDLLRNQEEGASIVGEENKKEIWRITKKYSATDFPKDESSLGLPIDVEFISIGSKQTEYLMNFDYLKDRMAAIGCDLLNRNECRDLGLVNSSSLFHESYDMAIRKGEKFAMGDDVKRYSFLNRWFIFKRNRGGPMPPKVEEAAPQPEAVAKTQAEKLNSAVEPETIAGSGARAVAALRKKPKAEEVVVAAPQQEAVVLANASEKKYKLNQIFRFYPEAELIDISTPGRDVLELKETDASRYLAPLAFFPIMDKETGVEYPSVEHFMAAMKYKVATNKPDLAQSLFSSKVGSIHQEYKEAQTIASSQGAKAISPELALTMLKSVRAKINDAVAPEGFTKWRATFETGKWLVKKDEFLTDALRQRWEKDAKFRRIVMAAKVKNLYLLYFTGPKAGSELGGHRTARGTIEGENKVGRIIMSLAGYTP